jgi:hypothetical protein
MDFKPWGQGFKSGPGIGYQQAEALNIGGFLSQGLLFKNMSANFKSYVCILNIIIQI